MSPKPDMVFGHHRTTLSHDEARGNGIIRAIIELDISNHFR
jgi:hypothetical protein